MYIGIRIRKLRLDRNWTLEELKNRTGLSISFLSDIERGVSNPSLEKLKILAEKMDVSMAFLLGEMDIPDRQYYKNVPVLYTLKNNHKTVAEKNKIKYHTIDLKEQNKPDEYFFIKMQDNSMEGSGIIPGSLVLVRKQDKINNGEIAAVTLNNNDIFLIRKIYTNNDTIILQPENNKYETKIYPLVNVEIVGKVISTRYYFEEI